MYTAVVGGWKRREKHTRGEKSSSQSAPKIFFFSVFPPVFLSSRSRAPAVWIDCSLCTDTRLRNFATENRVLCILSEFLVCVFSISEKRPSVKTWNKDLLALNGNEEKSSRLLFSVASFNFFCSQPRASCCCVFWGAFNREEKKRF